jgi:monoamine oxidase
LAIPTETAILNRRSSVYLNKGNSPTATRRFAILDKHHWRIVADLGNGVFMRVWNVGIVGGGPGGLMTAYTLQKLANSPLRVTLYEAGPRLGGKILTPCFRSLPIRYEAGAAEFYDYSQFDDDSLKSLIAELGLPVRPMGGPAVVINHRILANLDDLRDELGLQAQQAVLAFDRLAKDQQTPQEFYHSDFPDGATQPCQQCRFDSLLDKIPEPNARQYVRHLVHSDLAAEPCQTNVPYGLQNYLMNDPAYMHLYGIEGGNERLPQALAERIDASVLLEHSVTRVAASAGKLQVESRFGGNVRRDEFDFVVVALPHNRLASVEYGGTRLATAMAQHRADYDHPAHYLRITILFEQPFWRDACADSYWMLDQFGGCCLYDESSRDPGCTHGVLGWLLGGDAARAMSEQSDEQLIAAALNSLPAFLSRGRHDYLEGRVHRWVGAVNAMPGGTTPKPLDRRHQPEPTEHSNLFVVGDYLYDSTLNGVLDSAEYVSAWIAAEMADRPA